MIQLHGVRVEKAGHVLLDGVTLSLGERRIGLIGANGSGKSTLLRTLVGLARTSAGVVVVDGLDVAGRAAEVRRRVGLLMQNPDAQIVMPTVMEDLAMGLRARGVSRAVADARIGAALARLGIGGLGERMVHALSGGEKQLVALAGVLVLEPERVLFDEPTTMLDLPNRRRVATAIHGLDLPVIVASHDLDLLSSFDRVIALEAGRVVDDGPPAAVIAAYEARFP